MVHTTGHDVQTGLDYLCNRKYHSFFFFSDKITDNTGVEERYEYPLSPLWRPAVSSGPSVYSEIVTS